MHNYAFAVHISLVIVPAATIIVHNHRNHKLAGFSTSDVIKMQYHVLRIG